MKYIEKHLHLVNHNDFLRIRISNIALVNILVY